MRPILRYVSRNNARYGSRAILHEGCMSKHRDDWGLGDLSDFLNLDFWPLGLNFRMGGAKRYGHRRSQMFESGEVKFVILRLLREKPRHGYEIIRALEERL